MTRDARARIIAGSALMSANELRVYGRKPVRIRMHPDDASLLREAFLPDHDDGLFDVFNDSVIRLWGFPIEPDEKARPGEPVAEFREERQ